MESTTYGNLNNMRAVKIPGTQTTEALLMMPRCFVAHEALPGGKECWSESLLDIGHSLDGFPRSSELQN
jgi:hypothetical protein